MNRNNLLMGAVIVLMLLGISDVIADDNNYRVGFMPASHHFKERSGSEPYNETHGGILLEYRLDPDRWLGVSTYENSVYDTSSTIYISADHIIYDSRYLDVGVIYGLVSGYSAADILPYALLSLTVKPVDHTAVRIIAVPTVVAVQFMLEF